MKIVCPTCRTPYDLNPEALGSDGRQVRCVRCKTIWFAEFPARPPHIIPAGENTPPTTPAAPFSAAPEAGGAVPMPEAGNAFAETESGPLSEAAAADAESHGAADVDAAPEAGALALSPEIRVDIESVAARRITGWRARRLSLPQWRMRKLAAAIIVLAAIDASLIIGRADVVRILPQTASLFETIGLPVNVRSLAFKDIRTSHEQHDGAPVLVVEGVIAATGDAITDIPRLRFSIGAANGHEIYAWTALPKRTKLAPGETLPFRTRLASPPQQGRSVKVRFFTRHDLATGLP